MIDLFKHFHFQVIETEEEKRTLYKQVPNRNLIPRENVYYCKKNIKGYNNPFRSPF